MENNPEQPISQPTLVQQSLPPKNKFPIKFFIIFVLISTLIAFIAGGYFLRDKQIVLPFQNQQKITPKIVQSVPTPTSNPTANWKIYNNHPTGISQDIEIKYPQDWGLKEPSSVDNPTDAVTYFLSNGSSQGPGNKPYVYMTGFQNQTHLSFKDFVTSGLSQDIKNNFIYKKSQLNDITVYETESLPSQSGCLFKYLTKDEIIFVEITLCPYDSKNPSSQQDQYLNIFNQILSTFKFTPQVDVQNQTTDTSTWKTYINKQYGFQIKYPSDGYFSDTPQPNSGIFVMFCSGGEFTEYCGGGSNSSIIGLSTMNKNKANEVDTEVYSYLFRGSKILPRHSGPFADKDYSSCKVSSVTIDNVNGVQYDCKLATYVYWQRDADSFFYNMDVPSAQFPREKAIFNQMLSTFKFTN